MRAPRTATLPDCVPPAWLRAIDAVGRTVLGRADVSRPEALIAGLARLSAAYTRERGTARTLAEAPRSPGALAARLRFFLPRDLAKIGGPLDALRRAGALPAAVRDGTRPLRVLDLGAGLGATSLGTATWLRTHGLAPHGLEVDAYDDDARALSLLAALARETPAGGLLADVAVPTQVRVSTKDLTRDGALPAGRWDLVLVGFALNELFAALPPAEAIARRAAWLAEVATRLADDGALVVLEPALRDTSRALQAVRDVLAARDAAPFVAAPCLRAGPCPMLVGERDWCHAALPLALPAPIAALAQGAGLRFEGLRYAYLVLRRVRGALHAGDATPHGELLRVVGDPLESKGKTEWFACGAPGLVRLARLDRERSGANAALDDAARGDVLELDPLPLRPAPADEPGGAARARLGPDVSVRLR
jgi:SAM-dependent methyltransferase